MRNTNELGFFPTRILFPRSESDRTQFMYLMLVSRLFYLFSLILVDKDAIIASGKC